MGEKYLLEVDYEKAEEFYLKAKSIEPKEREPYEKLYEIYVLDEQPEKQIEIVKEAKENLESTEYPEFEKTVKVIEEKYYPFPEGEVIAELGKLMYAPVEVPGYGWTIHNSDGFSFLKPNGTQLKSKNPAQYDVIYADCVLYDLAPEGMVDSVFNGRSTTCPIGGGMGVISLYFREGDGVKSVLINDYMVHNPSEITDPIFVFDQADLPFKAGQTIKSLTVDRDYYIYNPDSTDGDTILGPYTKDQDASYALEIIHDPEHPAILQTQKDPQSVMGPFWSEDEDGLKVYSSSGKKCLDEVDDVQIVSSRAIGIHQGRKFVLLDEDLNTIYETYADGGAVPVDGVVPILDGDNWKLIRMENLDNANPIKEVRKEKEEPEKDTEDKTEKKSEETPEPSVNNEDEEEPVSDAPIEVVIEDLPSEPEPEPERPVSSLMTEDEALAIARSYWNNPDPEQLFIFADPTNPMTVNGKQYYLFRMAQKVDRHFSTVDMVYVNAETGECGYDPV